MTASLQLRLRQIRLEAEGIASYELVPRPGESLPAFSAGAHIDLHLPDKMVRSYSLAGDPAQRDHYLIAVALEGAGRGGSRWLHAVPRVGDVLTVQPPLNDFELNESAAHSVFIAGGIGITPFMAMAARLRALGRSWTLHYIAASPARAAFVRELQELADAPGCALHLHYRCDLTERVNVTHIVQQAAGDAHLYCCGPAGMIDEFIAASQSRPPAQVHFERFGSAQAAATGHSYTIELARSGRRLAVPSGKTMLDILLDNGLNIQYACSQGVCGTCLTGVLGGRPDHRDDYLTADEKAANKSIMVCCSGSLDETLVLDL
jgi:vanillate O-demethylase ferredoxin subunit